MTDIIDGNPASNGHYDHNPLKRRQNAPKLSVVSTNTHNQLELDAAKERIHALWVPFWYGLDPYLEVDLLSNFKLFISVPSWLQELLANQAMIDFNEILFCGPDDPGSTDVKEICKHIQIGRSAQSEYGYALVVTLCVATFLFGRSAPNGKH